MCFKPEDTSRRAWIDTGPLPPGCFISAAMDFAMMSATKRNRELVADLAAERRRLGKPQVVGIGGAAPAHQTRLFGN